MVIQGKPRFFKKKAQKGAENMLWALLQPHAPNEPLAGPLTLVCTFTFPWRAGEKKSVVRDFATYPIQTRPDVDNLFKALGDVMGGLRFWHDDAQLSSVCLHKQYGDTPGITINLTSSLLTTRTGEIRSA